MCKKVTVWFLIAMLAGVGPALAMYGPIDGAFDKMAASDSYPVKFGGMLFQGANYIVESPYELLSHTYREVKDRPRYGFGLIPGIGKGTLKASENLFRAAGNFLTAPLPGTHGMKKAE